MGAITGGTGPGKDGHQKPCEEGLGDGLRLKTQGGEYEDFRDAADLEMMK